jgi:hypothetical protein
LHSINDLLHPIFDIAPTGREGTAIVSTPESSERPSGQAIDPQGGTEKPEPDESAKAKARDMMKAYEDRPTAVLPGSDNTVTGTAVNDWLDDDGKPIYGKDDNAENSA